ncbi:acetate--CoA ligase family protein [Xanthobacter flavus]|uniref:acetate--CoA ligase family protein n=1 Tax=Xanthobacter flavus TaxID=281 RepID=UPI0037269DEC
MSLKKLIDPASIAIVGVSTKKATFQVGGRAIFDHLRLHGYGHRIDLVTREKAVIDGVETVTSLCELSHVPDCVVISVPADDVYATVEEALGLGVEAFVVITGGFSESGGEGSARQARLAALVRSHGAAMLGPNTTGFVNLGRRVALSSTSRITASLPRPGVVGLVVQSGALGSALMEEAERAGIGLSHVISTGNEAATGLADFVQFLADDPTTRAIALYVEGIRESGRLLAAARSAHAAGKPVTLYKAGRSEAGRRTAAGHTGALVGERGAYEAAVRQLGWVDVAAIEDLLPVAQYMATAGATRSIGILTVSGGYGGCVSDALESSGAVSLPAPGEDTVARMRADIPPFLSTRNPVDIAGTPFRRAEGFATCLDAFADDPAFDGIAVANTPIVPPWAENVADAILSAGRRTGKPISLVSPSEIFNGATLARLRCEGVPVFTRIDTFVAAVAGAAAADAARRAPSRLLREGRAEGQESRFNGTPVALSEAASKERLKERGLAFPREAFVPGADGAAILAAARAVGYPVTLKGMAAGVIHKSELGLVAVAVPDAAALQARIAAMLDSIETHALTLEGFLLAETVRPQAEVILGLGLDPEFGPTLTFGAGGIYTEIMRDVAVRILPLDRQEVAAMIHSCRIAALLDGARGRPALDVEALTDLAVAVADLAPGLGDDFAGLELNPVGVGRAGEGAWILDATVFRMDGPS